MFFLLMFLELLSYQCYYPHTSRNSVSPIYRIFMIWNIVCQYIGHDRVWTAASRATWERSPVLLAIAFASNKFDKPSSGTLSSFIMYLGFNIIAGTFSYVESQNSMYFLFVIEYYNLSSWMINWRTTKTSSHTNGPLKTVNTARCYCSYTHSKHLYPLWRRL